ncbi:tetratricopeptide repeat protein [Psychromarinibacter sp. S121]|uniref:tetratricopeptide repeat protein n=1 Tax=Psychromarinibacter sp. S121 TaxID=3415127 RepID=UPI003C7E8CC8
MPATDSHDTTPKTPLALARQALAEGRRRRAKRHLRDAAAAAGSDPERLEIALLMARADSPDEALATAGAALHQDQPALRVQMLRLRLFLALGRGGDAETLARALVAAHPADPRPALALAELLETERRTAEALDLMRAALPRLPDRPGPRLRLAHLELAEGRPDAARAALEDLTGAPGAPAEVLQLARLYARMGESRKESALLADRLETGDATDPRLLAYLFHRTLGYAPDAAPIERACAALAPVLGPERVRAIRLKALLQDGDPAGALAVARDRGTRTPEDAAETARALFALQRGPLALRYLRFCLRRWPASLQLRKTLFIGLRKGGELARAAALLAAPDARGPDFDTLRLQARIFAADAGRGDGAPLDLDAVLTEVEAQTQPDERTMQILMQHLIARADLPRAERLDRHMRAVQALGPRARWRPPQIAQQFTELKLTASHFGAERLRTLADADAGTLSAELRAASWSFILAQLMVAAEVADPMPRGGPEPVAKPAQNPASETKDDDIPIPGDGTGAIPKLIHQYWNNTPAPAQVLAFADSWRAVPGYTHRLYDRRSALQILRAEFGPKWVQAFRMAKRPAEEADFLRLCLLARHGGVWADADDVLTGDLGALVHGAEGLLVFRESVSGALANNVMAAAPGHPAILFAARMARQDLLRRSNETIWLKTGPGLLTRAVGQYIAAARTRAAEGKPARLRLTIAGEDDLRRQAAIHNPLGHKRTAAHWHDRDRGEQEFVDLLARLTEAAEVKAGTGAGTGAKA